MAGVQKQKVKKINPDFGGEDSPSAQKIVVPDISQLLAQNEEVINSAQDADLDEDERCTC